MKKIFFVIFIVSLSLHLSAQTYIQTGNNSSKYAKVDVNPKFPGGSAQFNNYVYLKSCRILKPNHAMGTVVAEVLIGKDGKVTNPKIIKQLSRETDSIAIVLLKNTPIWTPGMKNGKAVPTLVKLDLNFDFNGLPQPAHVKDVVLPPGSNADVTIDKATDITIDEPPAISEERKEEGNPNRVFISVDEAPKFPGGMIGFRYYIQDNSKLRVKDGTIANKVVVSFIVEKDGSLSNIKIATGLSSKFNSEAIRLMEQSPRWDVGMKDGWPVRTVYSIPIYFNTN